MHKINSAPLKLFIRNVPDLKFFKNQANKYHIYHSAIVVIKMYKCSKVSCSGSVTYSCICRDEKKYFCQTDILSHINDTSVKHDPKPIAAMFDESVKSLVLASLSTLKSEIQQKKKQIIDDLSKSITLLQKTCRKVICKMCDFEKLINKAIADIYFNTGKLENTNLKKTLTMTLDQAREECKDWNLVKVYICG